MTMAWQKWGSKQALEKRKTSLSLMEVFNIALKCSLQILRNPKCQNIDELRTAILQEWQQFPQEQLRCLVQSMTRRVTELHNKCGGYTRYCFLCLTHTHNRCI
jgi:hypothetical protein